MGRVGYVGYLDRKLLQMVEAGVEFGHEQAKLGGVLGIRLLTTLSTKQQPVIPASRIIT